MILTFSVDLDKLDIEQRNDLLDMLQLPHAWVPGRAGYHYCSGSDYHTALQSAAYCKGAFDMLYLLGILKTPGK